MAQKQPEVYWTWLPSHFSLLPANLPTVVPPPTTEASIRAPFGINTALYNFALRPEIPIVFALVYLITVFYTNAYNKRRNHQAWGITKTEEFGRFVVSHNVILALYSFATFVAMGRAIAHSLPPWHADNWTARTADGLCKLHGPRGLGDAATFNTTINIWEVKNTDIKLLHSGIPDPTDVGRLWNEGLAFWGWLFYVSKFYEVVDTFIVLAKGKRAATLQTYHHAGAMLCMWAGIRYMSPPIWMFVFVNSGIHALMYTYFTASALGVQVPQGLKRALTVMQITQFVWGASYAAAHLFIQYDIPISTPFQVVHAVQRAASHAQSAATSGSSAVFSVAQSPATATAVGAYIKKLLLRAAGEEGVAERIALSHQNPLNPIATARIGEKVQHFIERRFETQYRTDWTRINCIDTSGEAFAIYLNLLYLSPLTFLFVRFFIRAYSQRGRHEKAPDASQVLRDAKKAAREAKDDTKRSFEEGGEKIEDEVEKRGSEAEDEVRKDVEKVVKQLRSGSGLRAGVDKAQETVKNAYNSVANKIEEVTSSSSTQEETSSFKQKEQLERQSSSTWIKGSGGLVRRSTTSDDDSAKKGEDLAQSEETQDANLETSQATRPDPEEDTDAMGRSGALVDADDAENKDKAGG